MELVSLEEFDTLLVCDSQNTAIVIDSYIILNRFKTNKTIKGIMLEKCVRVYDYYLVFMTYDCPYEEQLTVSLLDKYGTLLEEEDIFDATYTDVFSGLKLYPPNIVTFDFLYVDLWKIEVYESPKLTTFLEKIFIWCKAGKYKTEIYWKVSSDEG